MEKLPISVSDAIALINQTMEYAYPTLVIEGEVSGFKVNQGKFVFFDIKDDGGSLGCFMMLFQLRTALEDGMRVRVTASPKLTQWGKFSLTVRTVEPIGEGSLKRAFDLLKAKLEKEGLFEESRKRLLPTLPSRIGLITSTQAAGYADFTTILNQRWGGMEVMVANVTVQGASAPGQMVSAIQHFNEMSDPPEVIVMVRGGGSADDLAAFNDEPLVRAVAASRVPTLVGVGHEVDTSLVDLAADVRAATPSNAAQLLVPNRHEIVERHTYQLQQSIKKVEGRYLRLEDMVLQARGQMINSIISREQHIDHEFIQLRRTLKQLNPLSVLQRGYAVVRAEGGALVADGGVAIQPGDELDIELRDVIVKAGVKHVDKKD